MRLSNRHLLFAFFSLLLLLLGARPIVQLVGFSMDSRHNYASHIVLVPFVSVGLIWLSRRNIFQRAQWSVTPGVMLIVVGAVLSIAAGPWATEFDENGRLALVTLGLIVSWLGGFLLFYGRTAFRVALFPLMFLLFAVPIPTPLLNGVVGFLQAGSAEAAYGLLRLSATPVYREGYIFALPNLAVEVAPECSGIRSGIALVISSLLAGHLFLRSPWRAAFLVTATIPILLFKNGLRIAFLTLLSVHYDKRILTSELHREGGIPFFILGLFLIYPILKALVKSERIKSDTISDAPSLSAQFGGFQ